MVGDGLNDAGALAQSQVGIAISEDANLFTPACDAILDGRRFSNLDVLLRTTRKGMRIIYFSFALSLLYCSNRATRTCHCSYFNAAEFYQYCGVHNGRDKLDRKKNRINEEL